MLLVPEVPGVVTTHDVIAAVKTCPDMKMYVVSVDAGWPQIISGAVVPTVTDPKAVSHNFT
tara:strand:+ start:1054 stop:1236 length:183 start_codon:yes stop_codon:yes gene_type:complete